MKKCIVCIIFISICLASLLKGQDKFSLSIVSSYSAHFIVKDPAGRRTGRDSRTSDDPEVGTPIREIPEATYANETPGDNPNEVAEGISKEEINRVFTSGFESPAYDGNFEITFIGIEPGLVSIWIDVNPTDNSKLQKFKYKERIIIDSNSVKKFILTYHGQPGGKIKFEKVVTGTTLLEDVSAMKKVNWIFTQAVADKYTGLFTAYNAQMQQNNFSGARTTLDTVIKNLVADSMSVITIDAYKSLRSDTYQLLNQLPPPICNVKLVNSTGSLLTTGTLQYRDSTWENATNNNDGTFTITTTKKKLSLRMTYAYGTQTKSNVTVGSDTIIFQTKNVSVNLQNSQGNPLDTGVVQYNAGGWQDFGTTSNGIVAKELLPVKYTFRLTYNGATVSKAQNIDSNATVVFQTVPAKVQLQTSTVAPLDTGIVQYNSGGWKDFGITSNGVVTKELLPIKYTFRMTYNSATVSKAQNIDSNATVVFQTVLANVQLQTSTGAPLDTGVVQFNAGGWKNFGTTLNGAVTKELLPAKYTFRMTYNSATVSKAQNIDSNATVIFQTVKTLVQFNNSKGNPIDTGIVQFNSGGWQNFGNTSNGVVLKELLPVKYTFRLTYNGSSVSRAQNVDSNATVVFSTVLCTVSVTNTAGSLLNNATVSYNAGGWKVIGTTINGIVTIELLPVKIQFRAAYGSKQQSVTQDVSTNPLIAITLPIQ